MTNRVPLVALLAVALVATGCKNTSPIGLTVKTIKPSDRSVAPRLAPSGKVAPTLVSFPLKTPQFVASTGSGKISGAVGFAGTANAFFSNNAANYHVMMTPSANALLTLTDLEDNIFTSGGQAISGSSASDGSFSLSGAPTGVCVVSADLALDHRLTALVMPGATSVNVDEASSMIAETARWQIRADGNIAQPSPASNTPVLSNVDPRLVASLYASNVALLSQDSTLQSALSDSSNLPNIAPLKNGAGQSLRSAYIKSFGAKVAAGTNTLFDSISDAWKTILGFRPLALTIVAGNGTRGYNNNEGQPATSVQLLNPVDALTDDNGDMFMSLSDAHTIVMVPKANRASGFAKCTTAMTAGNYYTIAGQVNGPTTVQAFNAAQYNGAPYTTVEASAVADPTQAPDLTSGASFPIFNPWKIAILPSIRTAGGTPVDPSTPHIFFTSRFGNRVFMIPGCDIGTGSDPNTNDKLFGRQFLKGRLYTIAGNGQAYHYNTSGYITAIDPNYTANASDQGVPASTAVISVPTSLSFDGSDNLYVLESGDTGRIRRIDIGTGNITDVGVNYGYGPNGLYFLNNAMDFRFVPGTSYRQIDVTDTAHNAILNCDVSGSLAGATSGTTNPPQYTTVIGDPYPTSKAGYLNTLFPNIYDISSGTAAYAANGTTQVLLNQPTSLDFDDQGNMVIGDAGNQRIRYFVPSSPTNGTAYTIAGGILTNLIEGDSRLCLFPGLQYINFMHNGLPQQQGLLVTDTSESVVRCLQTQRSVL